MTILLKYGTDEGLIADADAKLREKYRAKFGDTNLFVFDPEEPEQVSKVLGTLKTRSLFSEPVFISTTITAGIVEPLTEILKSSDIAADKNTVVLVRAYGTKAELTKKYARLWKLLEAQAMVEALEPLEGRKMTAWMQAFCKERGCTLPAPTAATLVRIVGDDSRVLMNEMAKLCAWQRTGEIPGRAVDALATPLERDANVFALTDAVSERAKRGVLRELGRQLRLGSQPHYLLSMYAFAIRNLITVKDLAGRGLAAPAISKKAGMHPFVVKKGLAAARHYENSELERLHAWLARADRDTKDGTRDATDTLYDFVLSAL